MQPLTDLVKGLDILDPFLIQHGFEFENYENGLGSGGQFTVATFKNERKKFIINYRYFIGQVVYQYDGSKISHDFYLDQLGLADKKKLPDFHSEDKLLTFRHILYDFEFLIEDFFDGECHLLVAFSKLQENVISEYGGKAREDYYRQLDLNKIEDARQKFKNKDFKGSMEIYRTVEIKSLLNSLDNRLIEFCEHHF
jgi:hypothetical protein